MKKFTSILLFATLLPSLWSEGLDFGLVTDSQSLLNISSGWSATQRNTQRLWAQFDSDGFTFRAQGRFTTGLALPSPTLTLDPDLETLKFQWSIKNPEGVLSETELALGRFTVRDPVGFILSTPWDGFLLTLGSRSWQSRMGFGYNGFLSKSSSSMALTQSDITDQSNTQVFFAPPRATGLVEGTLVLGDTHRLSLTYLPQLDLRKFFSGGDRILVEPGTSTLNRVEGGVLNTHHALMTLTGQVVSGFYYTLAGGFLGGKTLYYKDTYKEASLLGSSGTLALDWYLKDSVSSALHLQGWYTSGDGSERKEFAEGSEYSGDPSSLFLFKTLSNTSPGYVFAPQWGNLMVGEASYSFKILSSPRASDGLTTSLTGRTFFRPLVGPISSSRVAVDSGRNYLGTEGVISFRYRPVSDLSLSLTTGVFIPDSAAGGAFSSDVSGIETKVALYFSLSL